MSVMRAVVVRSFAEWREVARDCITQGIPPDAVHFSEAQESLALEVLAESFQNQLKGTPRPHVPRRFLQLAEVVAAHRDPARWNVLYRVLWRLQQHRVLLKDELDPDMHALLAWEHQVKYDVHKMHAFVRFRRVGDEFIAWHKPEHNVVRLAAPFFAERFAVMRWTIMTPDETAHWEPQTKTLSFAPGVTREQAPDGDALEELWKTYYASIFNPARVNPTAMKAEMPVRYWSTLPEVDLLPQLLNGAAPRVGEMLRKQQKSLGAAVFIPENAHTLPVLAEAVQRCQGCEIYCNATQAVFGQGPVHARMVLVGEQPGDEEDKRGAPFVGPAGKVFDDALEAAGIERSDVYVTNAVKHFKWVPRGKRRLHQSPRMSEIVACKPWLDRELDIIRPRITVALGAVAGKSLMGGSFALMRQRGKALAGPESAGTIVATIHPSAVLRSDEALREQMMAYLVSDLRFALQQLRHAA